MHGFVLDVVHFDVSIYLLGHRIGHCRVSGLSSLLVLCSGDKFCHFGVRGTTPVERGE
jgi:hypothetical protein